MWFTMTQKRVEYVRQIRTCRRGGLLGPAHAMPTKVVNTNSDARITGGASQQSIGDER